MSAELAALGRPLELPDGVVVNQTDRELFDLVRELTAEVLHALSQTGRDGAVLVVASHEVERTVIVSGSRGAIREQLFELGAVAAALAPRLDTRAPRGTNYVLAVDDRNRAVSMLLIAPGSELEARGAA